MRGRAEAPGREPFLKGQLVGSSLKAPTGRRLQKPPRAGERWCWRISPPSLTPMERPPDCRSHGGLGVKTELTRGLWCVTRGGGFLAPGRHWDFPLCGKHPKTPGEGLPPFWAGNMPLLALPCTDGALPLPVRRQAAATPPPPCTSSGPGRCGHRPRNPGQKGERGDRR